MNFTNILFIFPAIVGVGFLIGFHELGHFLFCKLFHIYTPSFSIGFGPKIISRRIGTTEFSLSAIPLGGYVEIAGAAEVGQGEQEHAQSTDEHSFARKPYYQKMLVMFGGIMFNLIFAYIALILLCSTGLPESPLLYPYNAHPTIAKIEDNSPAAKAGLQVGDTIIALDGNPINGDTLALMKAIQNSPNKEVHIQYNRTLDQTTTSHETNIAIGSSERFGQVVGTFGVFYQMSAIPGTSFTEAIAQGIHLANIYIKNTIGAFSHLFKSRDTSNMGGPVRIIQETAAGASKGFKIYLLFLAIISINLAVMNLIPLPILDGGQILFYTIEAAIQRPIPLQIREYIHIASWIAILLLTLFLTFKDLAAVVTNIKF
jgi:regulator of sigma E protease